MAPKRARAAIEVVPPPRARGDGSSRRTAAAAGFVLGRLAGLGEGGELDIQLGRSRDRVGARSLVSATPDDVGREVAVTFLGSGRGSPLVIGFVQSPEELNRGRSSPGRGLEARLDGERVILQADQEIEFKCGKASVLLRADGKVLVRGESIVSSAAGANRIRGGSVQIN